VRAPNVAGNTIFTDADAVNSASVNEALQKLFFGHFLVAAPVGGFEQ
jgi:hypothetical protein